MTNEDAIKWLDNLRQDIGQIRHSELWHYAQAIDEICYLLKEQAETIENREQEIREKNERLKERAEQVDSLLKEQEAENGEWITIWQEDDTSTHAKCSICGRISERPLGGYCKWCGAKMSQEWGVDG